MPQLILSRWILGAAAALALASCGGKDQPPPMPEGMIAWQTLAPAQIIVPQGVSYQALPQGELVAAEISGVPEDAPSTGWTGGVAVRLPTELENRASGHRIKVTVRAAAAQERGRLGVAYSTSEVGNSGWQLFELGEAPIDVTFEFDVPVKNQGNGDFLGFRNNGPEPVRVFGYLVEVLGPIQAPAAAAPATEPAP